MEKELFVRAEEVAREPGISKPYGRLSRSDIGYCCARVLERNE